MVCLSIAYASSNEIPLKQRYSTFQTGSHLLLYCRHRSTSYTSCKWHYDSNDSLTRASLIRKLVFKIKQAETNSGIRTISRSPTRQKTPIPILVCVLRCTTQMHSWPPHKVPRKKAHHRCGRPNTVLFISHSCREKAHACRRISKTNKTCAL